MDPNKEAPETGYVLIKFPQKAFTLFHELLGESQKAFWGEMKQFIEGGLKKQTLKTKTKAFCFCNNVRVEEVGVRLVSGPPDWDSQFMS